MSINTVLMLLGSISESSTALSMDYNKLYLNKLTYLINGLKSQHKSSCRRMFFKIVVYLQKIKIWQEQIIGGGSQIFKKALTQVQMNEMTCYITLSWLTFLTFDIF